MAGVGPVTYGDSAIPPGPRYGRSGEAIVQQANGDYYELASRGQLFAAGDQGAGVTVQVTITTTATGVLYNPAGSGKRLSLLKVALSYFSGTLGAGSFYHGCNPTSAGAVPSGGTTLTNLCTALGALAPTVAVGVALSGATVTAGKVLYPFASSLPILATTASNPFTLVEDVKGAITIEPGGVYQLLGVFGGTGSTPKVSVGFLWAEIPLAQTTG